MGPRTRGARGLSVQSHGYSHHGAYRYEGQHRSHCRPQIAAFRAKGSPRDLSRALSLDMLDCNLDSFFFSSSLCPHSIRATGIHADSQDERFHQLIHAIRTASSLPLPHETQVPSSSHVVTRTCEPCPAESRYPTTSPASSSIRDIVLCCICK